MKPWPTKYSPRRLQSARDDILEPLKTFPSPGSGSGYTSDVKIIAFRVTAEIRAELEQEARRTGLSASTIARARYLAGAQR